MPHSPFPPANPLATIRTFGNNFVSKIPWYWVVVRKLHSVARASAGHRTEVVHVAEHFSKRNKSPHHIHRPTVLHTLNYTTTAVQVPDHITVEILRSGDFNLHHRL